MNTILRSLRNVVPGWAPFAKCLIFGALLSGNSLFSGPYSYFTFGGLYTDAYYVEGPEGNLVVDGSTVVAGTLRFFGPPGNHAGFPASADFDLSGLAWNSSLGVVVGHPIPPAPLSEYDLSLGYATNWSSLGDFQAWRLFHPVHGNLSDGMGVWNPSNAPVPDAGASTVVLFSMAGLALAFLRKRVWFGR